MNDRDINHLHPDLQPLCRKWLSVCHQQYLNAFVIFTWRPIAEQDALYAQGRTKPGSIVTYAKGGQSKHNFTLPDGTPASKAFDFGIMKNGVYLKDGTDPLYAEAGKIGESLGLIWGGRWPQPKTDFDHLEIE